jgi:hypothetical protein
MQTFGPVNPENGVANKFEINVLPIPVAALFEAWVCSRLLAWLVVSNPTEGLDVCLL